MNTPQRMVYDVGETFMMTFLLPPDLQKLYKKDSMIIEAIYRGTISHDELLSSIEIGTHQIIAMQSGVMVHHVVEFANALWVNDLIVIPGIPKATSWRETDINLNDKEQDMGTITVETITPEPVRRFKHGSKDYNLEMIRDERKDTDGEIQVCAITGVELFYIREDGRKVNLRTHGTCVECGKLYSEDAMYKSGREKSRWPVVYVGAYCSECWPEISLND